VNIDGKFCIDATAVTNAQYAEFLAAGPLTSSQPSYCVWNDSFEPTAGWPPPSDGAKDDYPIVNVNFCDAMAYCTWAGKRLCGKVGGAPLAFDDYENSEFYYACSARGTLVYPYGSQYDATACGTDTFVVAPVKSFPRCEGGFTGVFDLADNIAEWEDGCQDVTGADDVCRETPPLGSRDPSQFRCDVINFDIRNATAGDVGIRCCSNVSAPP
jgi:formylglycine-generating enzyme required for sulfatase activity